MHALPSEPVRRPLVAVFAVVVVGGLFIISSLGHSWKSCPFNLLFGGGVRSYYLGVSLINAL